MWVFGSTKNLMKKIIWIEKELSEVKQEVQKEIDNEQIDISLTRKEIEHLISYTERRVRDDILRFRWYSCFDEPLLETLNKLKNTIK